jgi:hypothetical protein
MKFRETFFFLNIIEAILKKITFLSLFLLEYRKNNMSPDEKAQKIREFREELGDVEYEISDEVRPAFSIIKL